LLDVVELQFLETRGYVNAALAIVAGAREEDRHDALVRHRAAPGAHGLEEGLIFAAVELVLGLFRLDGVSGFFAIVLGRGRSVVLRRDTFVAVLLGRWFAGVVGRRSSGLEDAGVILGILVGTGRGFEHGRR